jgi:pimeloyl-ACP methyl ester carboxylesterase
MKSQLLTIKTKLLSIGYGISGPDDGKPVFLIHGWPDDVRTWDRLLPFLHEKGWKTIVPYLRGFGPTQFLNENTPRSGQITAFVQDLFDLADALGIEKFALIGHDWGARVAYTASALKPQRVSSMVALAIGWNQIKTGDLEEAQLQGYWYQWFFATELAEKRLKEKNESFLKYIWKTWATDLPTWEAELEETLPSYLNPDWIEITLHSYRVRWGLAEKDPQYEILEKGLASDMSIAIPVLTIRGENDPVNIAAMYAGNEYLFKSAYTYREVPNAGHFPQRENVNDVASLILDFIR